MLPKKSLTFCTALLTFCSAAVLIPHLASLRFVADAPTPLSQILVSCMGTLPIPDATLLVCAILLLRQISHSPQPSKAVLVIALDAIMLCISFAVHLLWFTPVLLFGL